MSTLKELSQLNFQLSGMALEQRVAFIASAHTNVVFTTSLGMEDQLLTWAVAMHGHPIRLATLQTGRLFAETLSLLNVTRERYGVEIEEIHPDHKAVENFTQIHQSDAIYHSTDVRKNCCTLRKVDPLKRVLADADVWITGMRRQQSQSRQELELARWDEAHKILKINPLADWTAPQVKQAISDHEIPVNPLHARGYPSIGCEPCTRAIKPGEPERAGRWWWEEAQSSRECGLHVAPPNEEGRVARTI